MSLFHSTHRKSFNPSGKFLHIARFGTEPTNESEYAGWTYHLVRHTTGSTVRRAVYSVTISDPSGNQSVYLTDFSSPARAQAAARAWIDKTLNQTYEKYSTAF